MPINGWHIRGLVGVLFDVLIVEIRKLYIIEFCNIAMAVRQVTVLGILEVVFFLVLLNAVVIVVGLVVYICICLSLSMS